jgi:hypothetical protein
MSNQSTDHQLKLSDFDDCEIESDLASDHGRNGHWKYMTMHVHAATKRVRFVVMSSSASKGDHDTLPGAVRDYNAR